MSKGVRRESGPRLLFLEGSASLSWENWARYLENTKKRVRWSALGELDMHIRNSLYPKRMRALARVMIKLRPNSKCQSRHRMFKSYSCVESVNVSFTDNSRYILGVFAATYHDIDALHHPSGTFMTNSIGMILGIDKTETLRSVGLMTTRMYGLLYGSDLFSVPCLNLIHIAD